MNMRLLYIILTVMALIGVFCVGVCTNTFPEMGNLFLVLVAGVTGIALGALRTEYFRRVFGTQDLRHARK